MIARSVTYPELDIKACSIALYHQLLTCYLILKSKIAVSLRSGCCEKWNACDNPLDVQKAQKIMRHPAKHERRWLLMTILTTAMSCPEIGLHIKK